MTYTGSKHHRNTNPDPTKTPGSDQIRICNLALGSSKKNKVLFLGLVATFFFLMGGGVFRASKKISLWPGPFFVGFPFSYKEIQSDFKWQFFPFKRHHFVFSSHIYCKYNIAECKCSWSLNQRVSY